MLNEESESFANTRALINMRNDVTELQKKNAQQEVLVSRFDSALDKISEVSLNVSKLLAVHEQRLETNEELVRKQDEAIATVTKSLVTTETGLRHEMANGQKEILVEIKSLRSDMTTLGTDVRRQNDQLKTDLEDDFCAKIDVVNDRVSKLERLSWIVIGGATVIGAVISHAVGVFEYSLN